MKLRPHRLPYADAALRSPSLTFYELGSAPASGAADGALAVRPKRSDISGAPSFLTSPRSPRGRGEQQPGRLPSPFPNFARYRLFLPQQGRTEIAAGHQPTVHRLQFLPARRGQTAPLL